MSIDLVDVSIFMPVYNGSKYLEESIASVLNQTFKNFELVCVDDSSIDDSCKIIKEFADKDSRIRLFKKANGGTVPKSWNFVLPLLKGRSITYMSQDDLMSEDNLEKMSERQKETAADCILPNMVFYYENGLNDTGRFGVNGNSEVILTNKEAVLLSLNWRIHGFALWKSKLFKNEKFPEDSFDSDEYMVRKLFYKCNKVAFCKSTFYYRQDNEQAITKSFSRRNYYSILRDYKIYRFLVDNNFDFKIVSSKLQEIYKDYIQLYRFHLLRKSIYSDNDYNSISIMLEKVYIKLKNEVFIHFKRNKFKPRFNCFLFLNYAVFKFVLFNVYILDKFLRKLRNLKNSITKLSKR
tara:strand:- start:10294 stop:11346 length:1053 start_codon:yes stop_codon:yes gene_type:complete